MDLLNRAYLQLYERFRSMTPGSRLTVGLLAAAMAASLGYAMTHQVAADVELPGVAVTANQMSAMLTALAEANLKEYEIRGTKLFVPRGQESDYLAALAKAKVLSTTLGTAPREAVASGSLWEFGSQRERERMTIAQQEELQKAICKMSGIESASVLFHEYSPGGLKEKVLTAVALVKPLGTNRLDATTMAVIRNMMAPFVGLKLENVTVSDLNAGGDNLCPAVEQSAHQERKVDLQQASARDLAWPGLGQNALNWLGQSWTTLSMIGLALVGLLVLRSMVRGSPTAVETAKSDAVAAGVNEEPTEARRANRRQRFDAASPSYREELSAIVEDDPETAANVLRNWIGQGV